MLRKNLAQNRKTGLSFNKIQVERKRNSKIQKSGISHNRQYLKQKQRKYKSQHRDVSENLKAFPHNSGGGKDIIWGNSQEKSLRCRSNWKQKNTFAQSFNPKFKRIESEASNKKSIHNKNLDREKKLPLKQFLQIEQAIKLYKNLIVAFEEESKRNQLLKQLNQMINEEILKNKIDQTAVRSRKKMRKRTFLSHHPLSYQNLQSRSEFQHFLEKQVQTLELKTNEINAHNKLIKGKIDQKRKCRKYWTGIFSQLEKDIKRHDEIYKGLLLQSFYEEKKKEKETKVLKVQELKINDPEERMIYKQNKFTHQKGEVSLQSFCSEVSIFQNPKAHRKNRKISFQKMMGTMKFISTKSLKTQKKLRQIEELHRWQDQNEKIFIQTCENAENIIEDWVRREEGTDFVDIFVEKLCVILNVGRQQIWNIDQVFKKRTDDNQELNRIIEKVNQQLDYEEKCLAKLQYDSNQKAITLQKQEDYDLKDMKKILTKLMDSFQFPHNESIQERNLSQVEESLSQKVESLIKFNEKKVGDPEQLEELFNFRSINKYEEELRKMFSHCDEKFKNKKFVFNRIFES